MDTYIQKNVQKDVPESEVGKLVKKWLKNTRTPYEIHIVSQHRISASAGKTKEPVYNISFENGECCPS